MSKLMTVVLTSGLLVLTLGCDGKDNGKTGTDPNKTGPDKTAAASGGKNFEAALAACDKLGINVTSSRPGEIINGVLPESSETGQVIVNMTFSGGRVKVQFFNAPSASGWESSWRKKIVDAIQTSGSSKSGKK
jgi:hypothetical protein